jgi:abequosyltransferase
VTAAGPVRLSICIPTYNFGPFIGQTLESILPQVVDGVEVVILDGGSTDQTPEVVRGFQETHPALVYERRAERGGIDRDLARTVGLGRGEYCWLFCSDDVMKPGAVAAMLGHIAGGLDIYVCGFTLSTREMTPIADQPISALTDDTDFDLGRPEDRRRYFASALTTPAFFSFAGSLVVRKARWESRELDEAFVGSCWAHVARLFAMVPDGLTLGYVARSYLYKRTENDSFMDSGIVRRYALAIDGYHRLAATFFGPESPDARDIRRVVTNEFPPWILLHAKAEATRERPEDLPLVDRLAARTYLVDPTPANRLKHLAYRSTPIPVYTSARAAYQAVKALLSRLPRSPAPRGGER